MGKNALVSIAVIVYNGRQKRCIDEEEQHVKSILEGFDPAGTGFTDDGQLWYRRKPQYYHHCLDRYCGEFVINLTPSKLVRQADWCGVKSGRDVDKFKECRLTPGKANQVSVPLIEECPINLECKVKSITPLGSHDMFLAEIVGVDIDEEYLDEDGKLHMEQCGLASYMHGEYFAPGKKVGSFGYSVRKRPKRKPEAKNKKSKKK